MHQVSDGFDLIKPIKKGGKYKYLQRQPNGNYYPIWLPLKYNEIKERFMMTTDYTNSDVYIQTDNMRVAIDINDHNDLEILSTVFCEIERKKRKLLDLKDTKEAKCNCG